MKKAITQNARRAMLCIFGGAFGSAIVGATLMLGPALGAANDADQSELVAAHQRACNELMGPRAERQDLESCVKLLLSFEIGPVEVFVSGESGHS
jgi:hypothetical protein